MDNLELGTYVANRVVDYIRHDDKIKAVKVFRDIGNVGLREANYFIDGIAPAIAEDAVEKEVTQYRKLREAGFSIEETMSIIKALA